MDVHPVITGNTRHLRLDGERRTLFDETLEMRTFWKKMHAPVLLLGSSNDFNAPDWNCLEALKQTSVDKRYTTCANYNHAFPPETMVADYLWFQDKLKGRVLLAGGGSQIRGLDRAISEEMQRTLGGGNVIRIEEPMYGGANGALKIAHDMPGEYWEQLK